MARRDRGALLSWGLLGAGLLVAGIVVLVLVFRSASPPQTAPPTTAAAPPPAPTTTAPPPLPSPVRIAAVTPFSVTIAWRTDEATTGRVALARAGGAPTLWSQAAGPAREHSVTLRGLTLDTDYRAEVAGHELAFHTPRPTGSIVAATSSGALTLDGSPFFPLMIWGACPAIYGNLV